MPQGEPANPGEAESVEAERRSAGPPHARPASLEGSETDEVGSVGAAVFPPGRPKEKSASSGGSEPHEVGSVGADFFRPGRFREKRPCRPPGCETQPIRLPSEPALARPERQHSAPSMGSA